MYNLIEFINNFSKHLEFHFNIVVIYKLYVLIIKIILNLLILLKLMLPLIQFDFKVKLTGQTGNNVTKIAEIMALLKYVSDSLRTLEMPLIECEITRDLNWSENCILVTANIQKIKLNHFQ